MADLQHLAIGQVGRNDRFSEPRGPAGLFLTRDRMLEALTIPGCRLRQNDVTVRLGLGRSPVSEPAVCHRIATKTVAYRRQLTNFAGINLANRQSPCDPVLVRAGFAKKNEKSMKMMRRADAGFKTKWC